MVEGIVLVYGAFVLFFQPAGQGPIVGVPIQNKAPITQKFSAALSVLSAILASAGFSSDYWIIHDTDSDTILHSGLFKTCWGPFCVSHVEALIKEPVWIVEVIAGLAGIGLMALSSILKVYKMCTHLSSKSIIGLDRVVAILGSK
ncbi:uncharacterized protein LOC123540833 [Mercenaria mercenaria]|uniref:uncharacterized protein LOC123540833 n=1 Tax=Mercenaria mercenaria TaxID=6596 RepID=UPI00234E7DFD|nr:uncharacterized protein LOC123540833 [Mercenaria mercenaria]